MRTSGRPRELYAFILRSFACARPPVREELALLGSTGGGMDTPIGRDLVQLGDDRAVAGRLSVLRQAHAQSRLPPRWYELRAMCAIDALGIPYLVGQAAEIHAKQPGSSRMIAVTIDPWAAAPDWTPADAVVVAATAGTGCTAGCACPHINLFASRAAAQRYLARPELRGTVLTVPEATAAGQRLFGDLLTRLADHRGADHPGPDRRPAPA